MASRVMLLACASLISAPAYAQANDERSTGGTNPTIIVTGKRFEEGKSYVADQVVTATKSDTPSKDVPFAVSSVTRAVIDDQFALTLTDALRNTAGSQPQPGFGQLNTPPLVRGFRTNSTLRDGFRQSSFYAQTDIADVAQVEVLKGPASALYGRFEAGGAVNIVSKKPLDHPAYGVQLSGGSDNFKRATVDLGGPLVSDTLLYRFNAAYQDSDSYRDFFHTKKYVLAPSIAWRPSADTTLLLEAEYYHNDSGFDRGYLVPGNFPTTAQNAAAGRLLLTLPVSRNLGEPTDRTRARQLRLDAILTQQLGNGWALRAGIFYSNVDLAESFFSAGSPLYPSPTVYNRKLLIASDRPKDLNGGIELTGKLQTGAITHTLLFDVDASDEDYNYVANRASANSPLNPFDPVYGQANYGPTFVLAFGGQNRYKAIGGSVQDEMALGRFRLLLGGRYDHTRGIQATAPGAPLSEKSTDAFSPRVGLTYLLTDQLSAYTSYSRSFLTEISGRLLGGGQTDPSRGRNIEGGLKASLLDGRLSATAAVYRLTKTNVVVPDPFNPGFSIQTGRQRSTGVEMEASANLEHGFSLIASYAHSRNRILDDTNTNIVGNRIVNAPNDTGSAWITKRFTTGAIKGIELGGGVFHVGDRPINNANLFYLPAYTRLDALVAYRTGPWRLAVNVNNLTDKKIFDSGASVIIPGAPRQVFVSLAWNGSRL